MVYVRKYVEDDFLDVKRIVDSSFDVNTSKIISTNNNFSLVAVSNEKIVGHVRVQCMYDTFLNKNYFFIGYVCVDADYRRLGIGKMLIDEVVKLGVENDISYIDLTSRESRICAHSLYSKCGFEKRETCLFRRVLS